MKIAEQWFAGAALALSTVACGGSEPAPATPPPPPSEPAPATVVPPAPAVTLTSLTPAPPPAPKLKLRVVTGSPEGFLANSTLVTGEKDAVLIDAQFTIADGKRVADAVKESGKNLTLVYVTHSHPDHYFG